MNHQMNHQLTVEGCGDGCCSPIAEVIDAAEAASASKRRKSSLTPQMQEACRATWESYCDSYAGRYGVAPVKNAKVAGMVVSFVKRVPTTEAPDIAAWYVQHPGRFYVERGHVFDHLLKDAELREPNGHRPRRHHDRRPPVRPPRAMASAVQNPLAECEGSAK